LCPRHAAYGGGDTVEKSSRFSSRPNQLAGQVSNQNSRVVLGEGLDGIQERLHLFGVESAASVAQTNSVGLARIHDDADEPQEIQPDDSLLVAQTLGDTGKHFGYGEGCRNGRRETEELKKGLEEVGIESVELVGVEAGQDRLGEGAVDEVALHVGRLFLKPNQDGIQGSDLPVLVGQECNVKVQALVLPQITSSRAAGVRHVAENGQDEFLGRAICLHDSHE